MSVGIEKYIVKSAKIVIVLKYFLEHQRPYFRLDPPRYTKIVYKPVLSQEAKKSQTEALSQTWKAELSTTAGKLLTQNI